MKNWKLPAIMLVGLALRLWGVGFGLPGNFIPDEVIIINKAAAMGTGDLNPHFFAYPTFFIYLTSFVFGLIYLLGWFVGLINSVQDYQALFFTNPSVFSLAERIISILFGVASIWAVWRIGKYIYSERAGLLSALLLSLCYLHVHASRFGFINIPMSFWMILCTFYLCRLCGESRNPWRHYIAAGICLGLSLSTKYTAVYLGPSFLCAYLWRARGSLFGKTGWRELCKLAAAAGFAFLALFITSPFLFIESQTFFNHFNIIFPRLGTFSFGLAASMDNLQQTLLHLKHGMGLPLLILSMLGLIISLKNLYRKNGKELALVMFVFVYCIIFLAKLNLNEIPVRYMSPLLPVLCLFASSAFLAIFNFLKDYGRGTKLVSTVILLVLLFFPSLKNIFGESRLLCRKDTRNMASDWIEMNIPTGSTLAIRGSSYHFPFLFESRASLQKKHDFVITLGAIRKGNYGDIFAGPRSYAVKLAQPGYPPLPNYHLYEIRDALEKLETPKTWELPANLKYDELKSKGLEYLIFTLHPTCPMSPQRTDFEQRIKKQAELLVEFNPLAGTDNGSPAGKSVLYKSFEFLVPIKNHSLVRHTGPVIRIYKL